MKRTNRKRISVICIAVLVIAAAVYMLPAGHPGILQNETDEQYLGFSTEAALDSITIKWKPRDHVDYYEICRLDISENSDSIPALKEYEKIASVNGEKRSYTDTDTVPGHTYAYVITGFRKSFGRSKQICTSFEENCVTYETAGPAKPGLLNNGNGENYENSKDKIYLYCEVYQGVEPDGVELYRKGGDDSDYRKIDFKYLSHEKELLDDTVTPGEIYTYKARTYVEQTDQLFYSPYSDELTIPAVNFSAEYTVESISGTNHSFVIKVTSAMDNGITSFDTGMPARYTVRKDRRSNRAVFSATLTAFSKTDGSANGPWQNIPKEGVQIKGGESIFLKYTLSSWEGYADDADADAEFFFGGSNSLESALFMDSTDSWGATYNGSGSGSTIMTLDLVSGKGTAYCDWDY